MKKFRRLILVVLTVAALSLLAMPAVGVSAAAPERITVSGSFSPAGPPTPGADPLGAVKFQTGTANWVGDLIGTSSGEQCIVYRPNGSNNTRNYFTFTGTVYDGATPLGTGTVYMMHTIRTYDEEGTRMMDIRGVILYGTGGLAGIHGVITVHSPFFSDPPPPPIVAGPWAYSGTIWFDNR